MTDDRAEGTSSGDASGNPSAIDFVHPSYLPSVQKLKDRGFVDAESIGVPYVLERVSYQHLMPYLSAAQKSQGEEASVKMAHDLLTFDRRFQSIVFKYIGIVEAQLRAQYSHWMEEFCGPFSIYDAKFFLREEEHAKSLERLKREIDQRRDPSIKRKLKQYEGKLPVWDIVEFATLGTISKLYGNTAKKEVTSTIANFFECSKSELSSWIKTITAVRNIMAHFEAYIVRSEIPSTPLSIHGVSMSNRESFYVIAILSRLLFTPVVFNDMNLAYPYRLWVDLRDLISSAKDERPEIFEVLNIGEDWEACIMEATGGALAFYQNMAANMDECMSDIMEQLGPADEEDSQETEG